MSKIDSEQFKKWASDNFSEAWDMVMDINKELKEREKRKEALVRLQDQIEYQANKLKTLTDKKEKLLAK